VFRDRQAHHEETLQVLRLARRSRESLDPAQSYGDPRTSHRRRPGAVDCIRVATSATFPCAGTVFGPFVIIEELGRGGMAVVYRAQSRKPDSLGRMVALKQPLSQNGFDLDFDVVRSFIDEARLAARFAHPNVARTYSLGKVGHRYFIEMEYVPGPTLWQLAAQCQNAGAIPISVVIQILIQICAALEHVHDRCDDAGTPMGLVHRDVSPSNIIVSPGGVVKLIDFGVVKGHSSQARTAAGMIKGKPAYVAPEYLVGAIDSRADLFAVGTIAHELLTDRRLFRAANHLETVKRVQSMYIFPPSRWRDEVPRALDAIVMKALERDPDKRWQTAAELRAALVELEDGTEDPSQIQHWVGWAFAQLPRRQTSELLHVIEALESATYLALT
jgi:serine/threonine-protein kinase